MGKPPAFQFYVRDWLSDPALQAASASSRGIWINALCYMWEAPMRGELKASVGALGRLLNATPKEFDLFLSEAQSLGFASVTCNGDVTNCNGEVTVRNRRMYREQQDRENTRERVQRHREKKAEKDACNGNVTLPSSSSSSSSGTKVPSKTLPSPPCGGGVTAAKASPSKAPKKDPLTKTQRDKFDRFWRVYPKRVGKGAAEKAFKAIDPDEQLLATMIEATKQQAASDDWQRDEGRYRPHPATWLNQRRWEDEVETVEDPFEAFRRKAMEEEAAANDQN